MASYFFNTQLQEIEIEYNTLHVPAGQRASVTLSDGTQVWLNAKSTLSYPAYFGKDERLVKIRGEAFFNVAKDRDKPFIVSTSKLDIKVLGTIFNVKDYTETDSINISLLEGAVEVYNQTNTSKKAIMKPNECLNYKDGIMTITQEINENEFLWKEGIYTFERERLENIVKKLELYYDTKIIIKNPYIAKYEYTGKFRQRDGVMEILKVIQQIHKFKVAKDEASNIIVLE
nr:FecR domain-containing protein [Dysgonomonas sp. Marseille-P4677]